MLGSKLNRSRGNIKEGLVVNSDEFLRRWAGEVLTLDLVVAEFWRGCGRMDLASAYVLRPLNHLVLDFVVWIRGLVNKRRSGGIRIRGVGEDFESEGRSQGCEINQGRGS